MKKLFLVLAILSLVLYGCLRTPPVVKEMITTDGSLSDWGSNVKEDATDTKWGTNNELLKAGLLFDGANIYIAGEYVIEGNVFLALIDLVGVTGAQTVSYTGLNDGNREFTNPNGDIDLIVEVNQSNEYKVWRVSQDGSLTDITDQVTAQFGTGSTIVELKIPVSDQVDQVKAVFAISGGTDSEKQWVGDFYPNQPDHDSTADGGITKPAPVANFVVCDSQGNVTEEINQTEPTTETGVIVVDGDLSDLGTPVATSTNPGGGNGANLNQLYVTYDATYLYIGFDTQNSYNIETETSGSWDVAYGIGIDTKPGGYYTTETPEATDAWGRKINFDAGYAVDYEIYFWWNGGSGLGTDNFCAWDGSGWDYKSIADVGGTFEHTGDATNGLQTMEIAIPWSAIGGKQDVALIIWITGGSGSAVDSIPDDSTIGDTSDEWGDSDTFTNLYLLQVN